MNLDLRLPYSLFHQLLGIQIRTWVILNLSINIVQHRQYLFATHKIKTPRFLGQHLTYHPAFVLLLASCKDLPELPFAECFIVLHQLFFECMANKVDFFLDLILVFELQIGNKLAYGMQIHDFHVKIVKSRLIDLCQLHITKRTVVKDRYFCQISDLFDEFLATVSFLFKHIAGIHLF